MILWYEHFILYHHFCRDINPLGQVPAYNEYDSDGKSKVITQSLAIMEYLQEKFPEKGINILTNDIDQRSKVIYMEISSR